MHISQKGIEFITAQEGGFRARAYKDSVGKWTIGVGHLILTSEPALVTKVIGLAQAQSLLRADVTEAEQAINSLNVMLTQNQFDALVSLAFNIGTGRILKSTIATDLKAGDTVLASEAFLLYNKERINGVLTTSEGLVNRRKREKDLFDTPTVH